MADNIRMFFAAAFLIAGVVFLFISAVGVLRLPEFVSRLHSSGIGETLGMILLGTGIIIYTGLTLLSVKVLFIILAMFLVNPVGTHLIGKAALYSDRKRFENIGRDEDADTAD
ncbi:MAG: monovalent cation/H(+) antiporter subunit G [Emergencia sp.]